MPHLVFHSISTHKTNLKHYKLIMKLIGFLISLFVSKIKNTWPTAMTYMLLLDTDKVGMMLYCDWLSSESYSSNPAPTPLLYNIFTWKWLHSLLFWMCSQLGAYHTWRKYKFGKYVYAMGIKAIFFDLDFFDHFS